MTGFAYVADEPEYVLVVLQDHGPNDGGWGPATVFGLGAWPKPLFTTRSDEKNLRYMKELARTVAQQSGKKTKLVRFKLHEELMTIGGSS